MEHKKCPTIIIEDVPIGKDEFKDDGIGAHERVANAISELLMNEHGGKVIGLEGKWGAGKSNVVKIIRNKCESDDFAVVQFDAWAHVGDPLRRTYLETVIQSLQKKGWIDNKAWDKVIEELAKRVSSNSRRVIPAYSKLGIFFGLSVLFLPLGNNLLSSTSNNIFFNDISEFLHVPTGVLGLLFIFAPFIILFLNLIRVICKRLKSFIKPPSIIETEEKQSEWAFLNSQSLIRETSHSIQTPEPTSIEFEKYFSLLLNEALSKRQRKILLVLDNLDRVEPKTALEIWSTLQAFVQEHHHRDKTWFPRLWILVPNDPEGLKRIWEQPNGNNSSPVADSFFDKSFQIRFQVPPPVLSNWKKYLYELLQTALPNHGEKDKHEVYQVFSLLRENPNIPPTPRQLKIFVNQLGAIHRQWEDNYPLADMAYFSLRSNKVGNLTEMLRTGKLPEAEAVRILSNDIKKNMAGLAFNVDAKLGQELLLGDSIYNALINSEQDELLKLKDAHKQGFWDVLDTVIPERIVYCSDEQISNVIHCFQNYELIENAPIEDINSIKEHICKSTKAVPLWNRFNKRTSESLITICQWKNDLDFSKAIYSTVTKSLVATKLQPNHIGEVTESTLAFLDGFIKLGHLEHINSTISLNLGVEEWFSVCEYIEKNKNQKIAVRKIVSVVKVLELENLLITNINNGRFDERQLIAMKVTPLTAYDNKWENLVKILFNRLNFSSGASTKESNLLLTALFELSRIGTTDALTKISSLVHDGHILHYLEQAHAETNIPAKALMLFTYLREKPDNARSNIVGNGENGYTTLSNSLNSADKILSGEFVKLLYEWNEVDLISKIIEAKKEKGYNNFIVECLRTVIDSERPEEVFTPDLIYQSWTTLKSKLGADFDKLLDKLATKPELYNRFKEDTFYPQDAELFIKLISKNNSEVPAFKIWLKDTIEKLNTEEWTDALNDNPEILDLLLFLEERDTKITLDTAFSDALKIHAAQVITGQKQVEEKLHGKWQNILSLLKNPIRIELRNNLLELVNEAKGKISSNFMAIYKDEIFTKDTMSSNAKTPSNILVPMLQERQLYSLNWMNEFFRAYPRFLEDNQNTANDAFKIRLQRSLIDTTEDDAQKIIVEIAKTLNIETLKSTVETEIETTTEQK